MNTRNVMADFKEITFITKASATNFVPKKWGKCLHFVKGSWLGNESEGFKAGITIYDKFQSWHFIVMWYMYKYCKFWKFALMIIL